MNTITCLVRQNEYQTIRKTGVTPAEAVILRQIHAPAMANQAKSAPPEEQKNLWKCLENPVATGTAKQERVTINNDEEEQVTYSERTNQQEVARLRSHYNVRAKSGAHGSHILDDLFPGQNPQLPETFEDIGMEVAAPAAAPAPKAPKAPKEPKAPKAPKEPKAPKAPKETPAE